MTNTKLTTLLGAAALVGLAACSNESFDIQNTNAPTVQQLTGTPTKLLLARAAVGVAAGLVTDAGAEAALWASFGREGWNLLGNDPRNIGETLHGPLDPAGVGGGQWAGKYQALRTVNTYLTAIDKAADMTAAEKAASKGFAQTLKAQMFHRLIVSRGKLGVPIHVEVGLDQPPAKFESEATVFNYVLALLDSAQTNLQAGGAAFPFNVPAGLTAFNTPTDFIKLNRGLKAKVFIHQATFLPSSCTGGANGCFTAALAALGASFIDPAGDLTAGANYFYSASSGETNNPITEPLSRDRFYVHPSYLTDAQLKGNGDLDDRYTEKVRVGTEKSLTQPSGTLTGTLKPIMYNTNTPNASDVNLGAPIPWLKNEELILLRAEANLALGNIGAAITDLNVVRTRSGGLDPYAGPASAGAVFNELIYNRRYSLLWEQGTRWIDARRYGITATLPIDRPGDLIFSEITVPAGECDSRGLTRPCDPLSAGK